MLAKHVIFSLLLIKIQYIRQNIISTETKLNKVECQTANINKYYYRESYNLITLYRNLNKFDV